MKNIIDSILGRKDHWRLESSLSRILRHIENDKTFGVVSAFAQGKSRDENEKSHERLKSLIRKRNLSYIELNSRFTYEDGTESEEFSCFIPNATLETVLALGETLQQFSVLYKGSVQFAEIGTSESNRGSVIRVFKSGAKNDILSLKPEDIKSAFSSLSKGSHRGLKFAFVLESVSRPSAVTMVGGYDRKRYATSRIICET